MKDSVGHRTDIHYYSEAMAAKLEGLRHARVAMVEAPPGYGKTTAVRDRLCAALPVGTPLFWLTATVPDKSFGRFARIICKVDPLAGQRLLAADPLNAVTLGDACDAIRSIRCERETYLVIDNFHLLNATVQRPFLTALLEHGGQALRVVLLTHPLSRNALPRHTVRGFMKITTADLTLDAADIRRYYALSGVAISRSTAAQLVESTGGWMAAISLQLRAFLEKGAFFDVQDILSLLEHMVWDALTAEQQAFLMRLSPFDTVTVPQMCALLEVETLPEYAWDALSCPFIEYEALEQHYEMNTILSKLLVQKRLAQGEAFNRQCLRRAGQMCRDEGRLQEAMSFFWQAKDYAQCLALDFSQLLFEYMGDISFAVIAWDVVQHGPIEIKQDHPLSMLRIALALLAGGMAAPFRVCMGELREMLQRLRDPPELLAEWLLLDSLGNRPDLERMLPPLLKAAELLQGKPSQVVQPNAPWGSGNCVPLAAYHAVPGRADAEAELFDQYMYIYAQVTNGHGSGAGALYRAQLAYQRGDLQNAEILAYQATYQAETHKQSIVQLWAAQQLAQVALHKADTAGWQQAISNMERAASQPMRNGRIFQATLDIARGILLSELHQFSSIATWLKTGDFSGRRLLPDMIPMALFVHISYLLGIGEAARVVGITQARYAEGLGNTPMLVQLFALVNAGAFMQMKDPANAVEYTHRAAEAALPDGLYFHFASFAWMLDGLCDELIRKEFPGYWEGFLTVKQRFGLGWAKLSQDMMQNVSPDELTPRENEVAKLAAQGLRNGEIAQKLSLSEATVRAHLRTIFQKLDIDRRAKLAERLNRLAPHNEA